VFFSGSGHITAAGLQPVPEPMSGVLFATGVAGVALLHKYRTMVGGRRARYTR
jgi:hypothetical protein